VFNSIRGVVTGSTKESVFILTGGVEWDVSTPLNDAATLKTGDEGRLYTWLYHREDQMRLFGFIDERRRNTFLEMLKVEGIGPKGALKIMSGISQDELEKSLEADDLGRLESVPGLGKKTAQKMLLTMKGKLVRESDPTSTHPYGELVEALVGMGYDKKAASAALSKAAGEIDSLLVGQEKENVLFRKAILLLSGA
jgi:Holliday junction DNA helicase RuvA